MRSLRTVLALATQAYAGLRFPYSILTLQYLDPFMRPAPYRAHLYHMIGGDAFNATITGDVGARGICTTC